MNKVSKGESGFSLLEGLLVVIVIVLIGFVGYYVWHARKGRDQNLSNSTASTTEKTTPTTPTTSSQKYLIIKEWGVEIPLTHTISAATYTLLSGTANNTVGLGLSTIPSTGVDSNECADASGSPLGDYVRQATGERAPSGVSPLKVGNYYYYYQSPQFGCSSDTNAVGAATADFNRALQSIKAVH